MQEEKHQKSRYELYFNFLLAAGVKSCIEDREVGTSLIPFLVDGYALVYMGA